MDISSQSKQADELRKQGKYLEAIPLYQEQIKASSSSYPTRWLIYCLRKSGNLENAYKNGLEALKKFPEDQYLRSEMGWVIYDREIKPGRDAGDIGQVVNAATRALELDPNNTFLVDRVCLVVMKTGKNAKNPDWQMIARFAQKIDPTTLSIEIRKTTDGKQYMSEMEDWYVNFSHAYLKCGEYQKAIEIALEGMKTFPNELFLARTVALAHFRSGNTQAGVDMMRPLLNHPKCQWYIRSELAEMEIQLGNSDEAYRLLCQALLTKQEDQFKVKNLETYASLSIKMNRFREAKAAIAFASAIRTNAGWSLPDSLISLLSTCNSALQKEGGKLPETISHQAELAKICYGFWKEGALEGLERIRGKVTQIRPDRKYAFIQPEDGGDSVIVFLRDLPRDCSVENTPVEFSREKSFDVKKNRDSYKAVQIQRLNR